MNLLIVDDSVTQRLIIKSIADSLSGVENIYEAAEGNSALEILANNDISLVFSDINMEPMSGFELWEEVKKMERNIHFAFITSHLTEGMQAKARESGVQFYITKPITQDKISDIIKKLGS